MKNTLFCRFWLLLALTVTVYFAMIALRAEAQERGRINSSLSIVPGESSDRCLTQGLNVQRNVSIVGKTIFAECSCGMQLNERLCTVWKLGSNETSHERSHVNVFTKFSTSFVSRATSATTGTCQDYTRTINKLYGSDQEPSYYTAQEAKAYSIDWSFCDDMPLQNDLGCNYTIVPTNSQNSSSVHEKIHYYVPSFTNASQHLEVGKSYKLDIGKCQHTAVVEIAIKNDGFQPISLVVKTRAQIDVTKSTTPPESKTNGGMFSLGNNVLYTVSLAALLSRMFGILLMSPTP